LTAKLHGKEHTVVTVRINGTQSLVTSSEAPLKRLIHISPETVGELKLQTETGPGYQVVSVMLKDGRRFDQVVTSEGCIIEVRGHAEVPFTCHEVATLTVNHRHWNFRTWSDKGKLKSRVAAV
jgi:hypothetical protein